MSFLTVVFLSYSAVPPILSEEEKIDKVLSPGTDRLLMLIRLLLEEDAEGDEPN